MKFDKRINLIVGICLVTYSYVNLINRAVYWFLVLLIVGLLNLWVYGRKAHTGYK